jgi:ribosomal-protein-alanine N-acetyltransferase
MVDVRPATADDRPRLRTIQRAALAEPWPELLETAIEGPLPVLVVAEDEPLGYAIAVEGAGQIYVPELAVDPDHQREGHGSALVEALCDRLGASGYDAVRLTVRAVDEDARAFYREQGFEVVDRVADHFESGDGLVMERSLAD